MIVLLGVLLALLTAAVVGSSVLISSTMNRHLDRSEREKAAMFRVLTARLVTDELGPGAELRALRLLSRDARAAAPPVARTNGHAPDDLDEEIDEGRRRRQLRDLEEGIRDDSGRIITPTGFE